MRSILSIIALFSCCTLAAQEYIPTYGREPMRGELLVYPSAREAAEADGSDNKYFKHLNEWTQKGNSFTTDFTVPEPVSEIDKKYQKLLETLSQEQEEVITEYCNAIFSSGAETEEFFYRLGLKDGLNLKNTVKSVLEMIS